MVFAYDGLSETATYYVYDGAADVTHTRTKVLDGFGRLVSVTEPGVSGNHTTYYEYDGLDRLTAVKGGSSTTPAQSRSFCHHGLGNLRRSIEPESLTTNYGPYDSEGKLLQSIDARGLTTTRVYDCAGRLVRETVANPGYAVERRQTWDGSGYNARLTSTEYTNLGSEVVRRATAYAGRSGRPSTNTTTVKGHVFTETASFNPLGLLERLDYPVTASDPLRPATAVKDVYSRGFLVSVNDGATSPANYLKQLTPQAVSLPVRDHERRRPQRFERGAFVGGNLARLRRRRRAAS